MLSLSLYQIIYSLFKTINSIPGVIINRLNHPESPKSSPSISNPKTDPIGGTEDNIADIEADPTFCEA